MSGVACAACNRLHAGDASTAAIGRRAVRLPRRQPAPDTNLHLNHNVLVMHQISVQEALAVGCQ